MKEAEEKIALKNQKDLMSLIIIKYNLNLFISIFHLLFTFFRNCPDFSAVGMKNFFLF